jgi:hypothetical protein
MFDDWHCPECDKSIPDECVECHDELNHKRIPAPPTTGKAWMADPTVYGEIRYEGESSQFHVSSQD